MDRKQWNRIGLATAAALLVPGGFLLGVALFARRDPKVEPEDSGQEPVEKELPAP